MISPFQMVCSSQRSPPFTADSELPFKLNLNSYKKTLTLLVSRRHYQETLCSYRVFRAGEGPLLLIISLGRAGQEVRLISPWPRHQSPHLVPMCQGLLPLTALNTVIFTKKLLFVSIGFPLHFGFSFSWEAWSILCILTLLGLFVKLNWGGSSSFSWHSVHFLF
jgi:hypothetical protein